MGVGLSLNFDPVLATGVVQPEMGMGIDFFEQRRAEC